MARYVNDYRDISGDPLPPTGMDPNYRGRYRGMRMTWQAAMDFANRVKARNEQARPGSPKEIVLLDVADQTASAKLTAWWGIDYLLLGKYDGAWKISQILWQSPPPKR